MTSCALIIQILQRNISSCYFIILRLSHIEFAFRYIDITQYVCHIDTQ